jgi:hypothetical protein
MPVFSRDWRYFRGGNVEFIISSYKISLMKLYLMMKAGKITWHREIPIYGANWRYFRGGKVELLIRIVGYILSVGERIVKIVEWF